MGPEIAPHKRIFAKMVTLESRGDLCRGSQDKRPSVHEENLDKDLVCFTKINPRQEKYLADPNIDEFLYSTGRR